MIKQFEGTLKSKYQHQLLPSHYKALSAIKKCRTDDSPLMLAVCDKCDEPLMYPIPADTETAPIASTM